MCYLCENLTEELSREEIITPAGYNGILIQDEEAWYVESKAHDYLSQGDTKEIAISNFDEGLTATLDLGRCSLEEIENESR